LSASCVGPFIAGKITHGVYRIRDWVGPRGDLIILENIKAFLFLPGTGFKPHRGPRPSRTGPLLRGADKRKNWNMLTELNVGR
jgi:hypothetical protein